MFKVNRDDPTEKIYDRIIGRGYAVATICYHDIFPDKSGLVGRSAGRKIREFHSL
jgi:hypothetical protein